MLVQCDAATANPLDANFDLFFFFAERQQLP